MGTRVTSLAPREKTETFNAAAAAAFQANNWASFVI